MKERVFSILNIKKAESKYVFDLLSIQFFLGLANAFINIIAFAFFIYNFSVSDLPYAFLTIAGSLLVLNFFYEKLEHKFSGKHLLKIIMVCSVGILFFFWAGMGISNNPTLIFALMIWNTLFYMITGYAFWGLVSLLFNVRESKRVFSVVGAGDIPAKLIGYLSAPVLISFIGLSNMLLVAIAALIISLVLLVKITNKKRWAPILKKDAVKLHHKEVVHDKKGTIHSFFRNELIFSISLLSILSYNVFVLVDFTFIAQVKAKFYDAVHLASFIATFFAFGRLAALLLKLAFSSRVIERMGIISCLLITPVTLLLFSLTFFTTYDVSINLYIFGIMALLTEVLRSTIQEPVFFILFQPLSEHLRLKGHIIAKGYMMPISLVIVGGSLIAFPYIGVELTILNTVKILLVNLLIWAVVVFLIKKAYIKMLHLSIKKGVYTGENIQVYDQRTIDILLHKISQNNENEVVYALKLLESANYHDLYALLKEQLLQGTAEIKKYVLNRMEKRDQVDVQLLKRVFEEVTETEVKERLVSLLCKADPLFLYTIADKMSAQDYQIRKVIISQLLNQQEFNYLYQAGQEINRLVASPLPEERLAAVDIICELNNIKFTHAIEKLMNDADSEVKRNAIVAACRLKIRKFLPVIFDMLNKPATKYLALHSLSQYGDQLFEDIMPEQEEWIRNYELHLIKIAGKIKGQRATAFLLFMLYEQTPDKQRIIDALWKRGFQAEQTKDIKKFTDLMHGYLQQGVEKVVTYNEIPDFQAYHLIHSSIASEVKNDLIASLKICGMLWHKREVARILELVENSNDKLFNAMEMIELVLPKKIAFQINSLIDFVLDPAHAKKPFVKYDVNAFMNKVVFNRGDKYNVWTKAVCIYCSIKTKEVAFLSDVNDFSTINRSPILNETRTYVLKNIQ